MNMSAISDYLEGKILNFLFRTGTFTKPTNISIALLNTVPKDNDNGSTMDEVPQFITNNANISTYTQYERVSLGNPADNGNARWSEVGNDPNSAYYVYTTINNVGVYVYPLYLTEAKAQDSGNGSTVTHTFTEFPGITFYRPANIGSAGSSTNPDPDEIIYRKYDGNGFIQNLTNITFQQAGKGGWGTIKAVAIMDSSTYGQGNILMYAPLEVEKSIGEGDVVQFIPSQLEISLK
jgi:hypothetical protein